jgi:hypothetical protein
MSKATNTMPLGRLWLPLLDKWWGWIVFFIMVVPPLLLAYRVGGMLEPGSAPLPDWLRKLTTQWMAGTFEFAVQRTRGMQVWVRIFVTLILWFNLMILPSLLAAIFWFIYGARGWIGPASAELARRKRLAALFSLQDGAGPDAIERYVHDDGAYVERVGAFLRHHQLRCPVPLYDDQGRYRFRCAEKADVLAGAMVRAVSRARDNELYVILADLAELGTDLEPLVKACRVARARRHHVMVIVPWPSDVPAPDDTPPPAPPEPPNGKKRKRRGPDDFLPNERHKRISKIVQDNLTRQYHESFRVLRRTLGAVGATVMRANDGDPVRLVLDRLDRLRGMRSRR